MAASGELKSEGEPKAYGAYVRDRSQLIRSASGGIATAIAMRAVEDGGVAYGLRGAPRGRAPRAARLP